jgi:hypothetical protein
VRDDQQSLDHPCQGSFFVVYRNDYKHSQRFWVSVNIFWVLYGSSASWGDLNLFVLPDFAR